MGHTNYQISGWQKSMTPSKSQFVTRVGEFYGFPEFF
jgi:hypothetical protein